MICPSHKHKQDDVKIDDFSKILLAKSNQICVIKYCSKDLSLQPYNILQSTISKTTALCLQKLKIIHSKINYIHFNRNF